MTGFTPLFIVDLLANLHLGEQIFVSLTLLFIAYEGVRVMNAGKRAGSFVGGFMWYGVVIFVAIAGAVLLGWVDPNPGKFIGDLTSWMGMALDTIGRWVMEKLQGMF